MVGGGLMRGIKIPLQDFALKIQGGALFARHYGINMDGFITLYTVWSH